jgi:hypothetical protein
MTSDQSKTSIRFTQKHTATRRGQANEQKTRDVSTERFAADRAIHLRVSRRETEASFFVSEKLLVSHMCSYANKKTNYITRLKIARRIY